MQASKSMQRPSVEVDARRLPSGCQATAVTLLLWHFLISRAAQQLFLCSSLYHIINRHCCFKAPQQMGVLECVAHGPDVIKALAAADRHCLSDA